LTSGTSRPFRQYPLKITAKPLVFPPRPRFFIGAMKKKKKKSPLDKRHANRIGVDLTTTPRGTMGTAKKGGRNGFSREQIGFVGDARASSHRAPRLSLSLSLSRSPRTLAWPKGLN